MWAILSSIKQEKGLERILSHLLFVAIALNPHHAVKGALHTSETDNCLASKTKPIESARTLRVANSTVYSKKNVHLWAPMEDNSGG